MIHVVILAHAVVFLAASLIWPVLVCLYYKGRNITLETEEDLKVYMESLVDGYNFGVDAERKLRKILDS